MCCKLLANAKWTDIRSPDKCQQCCSVFSGHVNSRTDEGAALDWHCQCLLAVHDNRNDDDNADDAPDDNDAVGEHDVDVDGDGDARWRWRGQQRERQHQCQHSKRAPLSLIFFHFFPSRSLSLRVFHYSLLCLLSLSLSSTKSSFYANFCVPSQ